jgi:hypothetical protein
MSAPFHAGLAMGNRQVLHCPGDPHIKQAALLIVVFEHRSGLRVLIEWLRSNGINGHKPLHTLRKEFGSLNLRAVWNIRRF